MVNYEAGDQVVARSESGGEVVYVVVDDCDGYFIGERVFGTEIDEVPDSRVLSRSHDNEDREIFGRPSQRL